MTDRDHLIRVVAQVHITRAAQAKYFRTRTPDNLTVAKMAEQKLDEITLEAKKFVEAEQVKGHIEIEDQISLFGEKIN